MIQKHQSPEYYAGCRDAVFEYAVHKNGEMRVGCGILSYEQAIADIDTLDHAARAERFRQAKIAHATGPA